MDCKRPYQHRALKLLLSALLCMAMTACTWVKDDNDDCPYGFWLNLHYTYNILDVEAAQRHVADAYVYIYDTEGNFVKRLYITQEALTAGNYRIRVEGLPEGNYQFVVWSGIGNSPYAVAGDTQTRDDFRLSLASPAATCSAQLPPVFYGSLPAVHYDDSYATYDIQLTKITNQLACLVVPVTDNSTMNPDDYTLKVVTANGTVDAYCRLATETATTYEPFSMNHVTFDDADYGTLHGLQFNIMTMRLMEDTDCRIILEKKSTAEIVFNISLPEYIAMIGSLYTNLGEPLSVQEYLDRQDFYTIIFYLSSDLDQLIQMQVNSWRLRAYNHLKL